jgi:hypothetical protein
VFTDVRRYDGIFGAKGLVSCLRRINEGKNGKKMDLRSKVVVVIKVSAQMALGRPPMGIPTMKYTSHRNRLGKMLP